MTIWFFIANVCLKSVKDVPLRDLREIKAMGLHFTNVAEYPAFS
jgi:hypothetical protein